MYGFPFAGRFLKKIILAKQYNEGLRDNMRLCGGIVRHHSS